ncbi:MAG TPA: hypothetical protein VFD39_13110 [Trueperaceae bacterium]|nr:hypothetical protein [Trueperaceae bacterium]
MQRDKRNLAPRPLVVAGVVVSAVLLLLAGCAPRATEQQRPLVAIMNAPADVALEGSAETIQAQLERDEGRSFDMVSGFTMRFLESHNDLFHSRAAPSAARIARTQGAQLAIMIGAPVLERAVTVSRDEASRRVDVSVALEAQVVDPKTDAVVQTLRTRTHQGSRVEANDEPLPEPNDDATVVALMESAAPELAKSLAAELPYLFSELLIGSSGG